MQRPAEHGETILGLDNVPLAMPVAGIGPRALAAFVDYIVVFVLGAGLVFAVVALGTVLDDQAWIAVVVFVLGIFAIEYGYFAGFEIALSGQTPGKSALGLRVVDSRGGRVGTREVLVRNAVRMIDMVVGVFLIPMDPLARRLGDRLAGTLVVHEAPAGPVALVKRVPRGWQAKDVAVVESFFRRRQHMTRERAALLARQLLEAIRRDDPELLAGLEDRDPELALRAALEIEGL